jgi:DNA-binding NarL/FixJ family response regulator
VGLRVVLAEDTVLLRDGMARLLRDAGLEVLAEVGDASALMQEIALQGPDVAVVDMRMPPGFSDEGLKAAVQIRKLHPNTAVLVFSSFIDETFLDQLIEEAPGGLGYLLKDRVGNIEEFVGALERVAAGESVVDRSVVDQLMRPGRADDPLKRLTERERDVLALMAEGHSNSVICRELFISPKTLERHIGNIFVKLDLEVGDDLNRRVAAVIAWLRHH